MGNRCAGTGNPAPDDLALSLAIIRSVPTRLNGLPVFGLGVQSVLLGCRQGVHGSLEGTRTAA